jgi:hypothetical protein
VLAKMFADPAIVSLSLSKTRFYEDKCPIRIIGTFNSSLLIFKTLTILLTDIAQLYLPESTGPVSFVAKGYHGRVYINWLFSMPKFEKTTMT